MVRVTSEQNGSGGDLRAQIISATQAATDGQVRSLARLLGMEVDQAVETASELRRLRARRDAKELLAAEGIVVPPEELRSRLEPAGDFIFNEPETIPAVWGAGGDVLWSEGEGVMIASHQGLGKTTIAQQLVLHRAGFRQGPLLGYPVARTERPMLYLAMDRPRQAARSMRRMVPPEHREALNAWLQVWRGPLPVNPLASPATVADWVEMICPGCGTLVVDSVKDLAPGVSKDEVGAALNMTFQEIIARGTELLLLHHERKAASGEQRHHALDDVYGSTWLTSGLGSVLALDGEPGDATVVLRHLKPPADPVGPLTLRHDHDTGVTTTMDGPRSTWTTLRGLGIDQGITVEQLAQWVYGRSTTAHQQRVRRELVAWEQQQLVRQVPGQTTAGRRTPSTWFITTLGMVSDLGQTGEESAVQTAERLGI